MTLNTQAIGPRTATPAWKTAIPALGFVLATLAGCAQPPTNPFTAMPDNDTTAPVANFKSCPKPVYPKDALAAKIEGTVTLAMLVKADGKVRESLVRNSSGNASLDETARAALAKCSFQPGTVNGAPKEQWTDVKYIWVAT